MATATSKPTPSLHPKGRESAQVKSCIKCKAEKSVVDFWKNQQACKVCQYEYRKANPERSNFTAWRYGLAKIGLIPEVYFDMLDKQGGVCAICKRTEPSGKKLAADHCHTTGKIRGLLCRNCNVALGLFQDDPVRILIALDYLAA